MKDEYAPTAAAGGGFSRRTFLTGAGAAALVAGVAACGSDSTQQATAPASGGSVSGNPGGGALGSDVARLKKLLAVPTSGTGSGITWKLGALLPLTGAGAEYGTFFEQGIKLAVSHIQELGGPKIDVSYMDNGSGNPSLGVQAVRQYQSDGIGALISSYNGDLYAILPDVASAKIMTVDMAGTGSDGESKPYFWGAAAIFPDDDVPGIARYIRARYPKVKRVAIVEPDRGSAANSLIQKHAEEVLGSQGLQLCAFVLETVGTTDFSVQVQDLVSANPDFILPLTFGLDTGYLLKQLATSAVASLPVIGVDFTSAASKIAGSAYDKWTFAFDFFDPYAPNNPWSSIFARTFKERYGALPSSNYQANAYEDTFLFWDLFMRVLAKKGDVTSGSQLQQAMEEKPSFNSVYGGDKTTVGRLAISPQTHTVTNRQMGVFAWNHGIIKPLAYFNIGGADFHLA